MSWGAGTAFAVIAGIALFACIGNAAVLLGVPMPPPAWAILLGASMAAAVATVTLVLRRRDTALCAYGGGRSEAGGEAQTLRRSVRGALPYLVTAPGIVAVLGSIKEQISFHGFVHTAYVLEVLHGHVPPENVTMPGNPANFYWLYHALLAALVQVTGQPPPLLAAIVNVVVLLCSLGLSHRLVVVLTRAGASSRRTAVLAVCALFGVNLLGGVAAILRVVAVGGPLRPGRLEPVMIAGDSRVASLFNKFLNYNGFPIGVACLLAVILLVAVGVRYGLRRFDVVAVVVLASAALTLHATSGVFILLVVPPALAACWLLGATAGSTSRRGPREGPAWLQRLISEVRGPMEGAWVRRLILPAVVAAAALAPATAFLWQASRAMPGGATLELWSARDRRTMGAALLPVALLAAVTALRARRERDSAALLPAMVAAFGVVLAGSVRLAGGNDYKFVHLAGVAAGVAAVPTLARWLEGPSRAARALAYLTATLALSNVLLTGASRLALRGDFPFGYEGAHIVARTGKRGTDRSDLAYADLYRWLRDRTPSDAIVVVPRIGRNEASLYVLAERLPFWVEGAEFNASLPGYRPRRKLVRTLYEAKSKPEERRRALATMRAALPQRRFFVVVPTRLLSAIDPEALGLAKACDGEAGALFEIMARPEAT